MSRIAILGDLHLWNHKRVGGPVQTSVNRRAMQIVCALSLAGQRSRCQLLQLGDFFDGPYPSPQLTTMARAAHQGTLIALVGNHDQASFERGDHALVSLGVNTTMEHLRWHVADEPTVHDFTASGALLLPFSNVPAKEYVLREIKKAKGAAYIMGHFGIFDDSDPPWKQQAPDAIHVEQLFSICERFKVRAVFAGHWHKPREWATGDIQIYQAGAFCPTGWGDAGMDYGRVYVLNSESAIVEQGSIPGPRFLDVADMDVGVMTTGEGPECSFYLRAQTQEEVEKGHALQAEFALKGLETFIEVIYEPAAMVEEALAQSRTAVQAARDAATLQEALHEYVKGLNLSDEQRVAVLAKAQEYLR